VRAFVVVVAAAIAGGCVSAVSPRLAEVAPRGRIAAELSFQAAGYARGEATTGDGARHDGNAAMAKQASAQLLALGGFFVESGLNLRYGLGAGCEAGGMFNALRLAGEGRCQLIDQDDGAALSLSVAAAVGYTPFYDRGGVWGRAGVDLSRLGRRRSKAVLLDVYASYGRESYSIPLDVEQANEHVLTPPYAWLVRREARISAGIGWSWRQRDGSGELTDRMAVIAVVPYRVIWDGGPKRLECRDCASATVTSADSNMGVALILSLNHVPGLSTPPARRPRKRR